MKKTGAGGFTLLELVIVLVVIGVLSLLTVSNFSGAEDVRQRKEAQAAMETVREALRYFILANKRLPCPDFSETGYESNPCPPGEVFGWVPYFSLGLPLSESGRMAYAVFRFDGNNDLTTLVERSGDPEGSPGYRDLGDAIIALNAIPLTVSGNAHVFVAGINADGTSDCSDTAAYYPAFLLIAPLTDRDSDGNVFDGINKDLLGNGRCAASPLQPLSADYDDLVMAESPQTLVGWLTLHAN